MYCLCTASRTWIESVFPIVSSVKVCHHGAPDHNRYIYVWIGICA